MINDIEAVIFDLDGTIADSGYVWKKVDNDFFSKRNIDIPPDFGKNISSMSFKEAAQYTKTTYCLPEDIESIMNEWYSMAVYEYSNNVKLKPYVYEYISKLKKNNIKIALCTASPRILFEPFLINNGIFNFFDVFVEGGEVSKSKEFPDIYILASQRLSVIPEKCLVFEDIPKAIIGAKKAGMKTIGVFDYASACFIDEMKIIADRYIYDFSEV